MLLRGSKAPSLQHVTGLLGGANPLLEVAQDEARQGRLIFHMTVDLGQPLPCLSS